MTEKMLGKIEHISLGMGGYQDAMFGLTVTLAGPGGGCCDFKGTWCPGYMDPDGPYYKWTEEDRSKIFDETMRFIAKIMREAKKDSLDRMVGVPVEVEFENRSLKSWRILTEVI